MLIYLALLIISAAMAAGLTKVVRDRANHMGLAFGPSSARHIHAAPIPRLGGVAIFFTFLIISFLYWLTTKLGFVHAPKGYSLLYILIPASGLFLVGLLDDLLGMSAKLKLAAQVVGGAVLYFSGFRLACLHSLGSNHYVGAAVCFALTVGFVVLVCNAINLIDGLDGLAAGAALFSMVTIFTFALVNGRHGSALAVTILAGANLGFLLFNFNPASIFLGDSGSLFIGFMLSGLVMSESGQQSNPWHSILVPIISLALPLTDLALTIVRRYLSGHSLFGADRGHIHHKLLELGLSQRQVIAILYGVSALFAVMSLTFIYPSRLVAVPVVAIMVLFLFFGIRRLNYQEFGELQRFALRLRQQKQVAASNIALHKAADRLEAANGTPAIVAVLENCLLSEFDSFKIILDPGYWLTLDDQPTRALERSWSLHGQQDKLVLMMDLVTSEYGKIGRLFLVHNSGKRLLVDSSLLQDEFRRALGYALEHCIIHTSADEAHSKSMAYHA
ncbi:MAG: undecaprenyl/decaprenyl-phosphate alpha-N-acetylglucosaminyl 1-phosphate transferase [Acidobacteriia bacterium]|nr:undecaprenyl/decaprenyl-phosphate alpha-N-acetylglucosaminyl 1-phosphate transferase [Terriglobia bacterium]